MHARGSCLLSLLSRKHPVSWLFARRSSVATRLKQVIKKQAFVAEVEISRPGSLLSFWLEHPHLLQKAGALLAVV